MSTSKALMFGLGVFFLLFACDTSSKKVTLARPVDGIYQVQVVFKQGVTWLAVMQRNEKIEFNGPMASGEPVGEMILAEVPSKQVDPKFVPFSYFAEVTNGQITLKTVSDLRK